MRNLKRVLYSSLLLIGMNVGAQTSDFVDWTPIFKSLENACSHSKQVKNILNDLYEIDYNKKTIELSQNAKRGSYKGIEAKYQRVMRPATFKNIRDEYKYFNIPLVKSKLYGLEISELELYTCNGICGINGLSIIFKPMSLQSYYSLKARNYYKDPYVDFGVSISAFKAGEKIVLNCDTSM